MTKQFFKISVYICLLFPILLFAQTNSDEKVKIAGEISRKKDGAVIPFAVVTVKGDSFQAQTKSDVDGQYSIDVPFGTYKITVESLGFKTFKLKNFKIECRGERSLNIALKDGEIIIVD